jgi:hypothetical protein
LTLRAGQTKREQNDLPQRNFSGATGNLTFDYAVTGITSINATMGRDLTPQDLNLANYAVVRSFGIGVRWAPTPKISTVARIDRQSREFGGPQGVSTASALIPTDTTRSTSLVLLYAPTNAIQLSMQLRHEVRESNDPTLPYVSNVGTLSGILSF